MITPTREEALKALMLRFRDEQKLYYQPTEHCEICHRVYYPKVPESVELHALRHDRFAIFIATAGYRVMGFNERQHLHELGLVQLKEGNDFERLEGANKVMIALFHAQIEDHLNLVHPPEKIPEYWDYFLKNIGELGCYFTQKATGTKTIRASVLDWDAMPYMKRI